MKQFFWSLVLAASLLSGCNGSSSMAEAIVAVQSLDDCKEVIRSFSIESSLSKASVKISDSAPQIQEQDTNAKFILANHVVIYRTKSDHLRLATVGSSRPPRVTSISEEFK